jgi:NADPH:quinone reductase-like Zn-dependent oxidoreductase
MSRVVIAPAYGGPEVLQVIDETPAEPGEGQVRIAVRAAGVNPYDFKMYSGSIGDDPAALPMRLGFEAAGVVDAVGPGVAGVAVGDEVIAHPVSGAYADYIIAGADNVFAKPASLGWPEAAGLMLVGVTAAHALVATSVSAGDTVLVHAAAGGVGLSAVQQAVIAGARVIGTAKASSHDRLRELGVEPVEYGEGLADRVRALAPDGVDAALDLVGSDEALEVSLELVADRDRIVTIANFMGAQEAGIKSIGGGPGADPGTDIRAAARARVVEWAGAGRLKVFVSQTFSLDDAAAAHEFVRDGRASGKVALLT